MAELVVSAYQGVKLRDDKQWKNWIAQVKQLARSKCVWDLIDPSIPLEEASAKLLQEPITLEIPSDEASDKEIEAWEKRNKLVTARRLKWQTQFEGLMRVERHVIERLDDSLINQLDNEDLSSLHAKLRYLSQCFGRNNAREAEVYYKWARIRCSPPAKNADILRWVTEWDTACREALAVGASDYKEAVLDFLMAIQDVLPSWWGTNYSTYVVIGTYKTANIKSIVADFTCQYREIKLAAAIKARFTPLSNAAFATAATFQN
ncbi:hypothetical protein N7488_001679 [Penicillium malachiteum]|nr:hypothetical protein N7488_001679 [Penicillium malachiteum]